MKGLVNTDNGMSQGYNMNKAMETCASGGFYRSYGVLWGIPTKKS